MAVAGWGAFTLYERSLAADTTPPSPTIDEGPGAEHLAAGRLDEAAAAYQQQIDAGVGRGYVGLAWVEVARAQRAWQAAAMTPGDRRALEVLDAQVDAARLQIAVARREARTQAGVLAPAERHLNALLVLALGLNGQKERAQGALHARLEGAEGASAIAAWLETTPAPSASSSASPKDDDPRGVEPEDDDAEPRKPLRDSTSRDFEFDEEPVIPIPTPGELKLPGNEDDVP